MKAGITGTQKDMNEIQEKNFIYFLEQYQPISEFHDGNCIGSDIHARRILFETLKHPIEFHIHPSTLNSFVKPFRPNLTKINHKIIEYPVKPPLERNHDIVKVNVLFATPKENLEVIRSGTWATIRYAKKWNIPVYILYPDGRVIFFDVGKTPFDVTPTRCPKCQGTNYKQVPSEYPILECKECSERWFSD